MNEFQIPETVIIKIKFSLMDRGFQELDGFKPLVVESPSCYEFLYLPKDDYNKLNLSDGDKLIINSSGLCIFSSQDNVEIYGIVKNGDIILGLDDKPIQGYLTTISNDMYYSGGVMFHIGTRIHKDTIY